MPLNDAAQCTGKAKTTGERCKNRSLKGKDTCRMHKGRPPVHGLYSKYKEQMVGDRLEELLNEPAILDPKRPIALIEALTEKLLEAGIINQQVRQALMNLAIEQSKAIERYYRIKEGAKYKVETEVRGPMVIHRTNPEVGTAIKAYCTDRCKDSPGDCEDRGCPLWQYRNDWKAYAATEKRGERTWQNGN